jgi:trigger factor
MLERATIDVPAAMVDEAVHNEVHDLERRLSQQGLALDAYLRITQQTQEELEAELRPNVLNRLQTTLLLQEVAKREELTVTEEQVAANAAMYAATLMRGNVEHARAAMRDQSFRDSVRQQLQDGLIRERLIAIATEDRGIVENGWTPPEPVAAEATADEAAGTKSTPLEEALTIGTMPGQPGDLADAEQPAEAELPAEAEEPTTASELDAPAEEDLDLDQDEAGAYPHPTI